MAAGVHQAAASANGLHEGGGRQQRVLALVAPRTKRQRLDASADAGDAGSQLSEDTEGSLAGAAGQNWSQNIAEYSSTKP